MTLTDLIAALERAEGPSRELDERLAQYGGLTRSAIETVFTRPAE